MSKTVSQEYISQLCESVKLSRIIKEYTNLTFYTSDKCYWGKCPFEKELEPSMMVDDRKGEFTCFSCGVTGNAVDFISKIENISKYDAVEFLSKKINMSFPKNPIEDEFLEFIDKETIETLYKINATAAKFYYNNLYNEKTPEGLKYFQDERKLSEKTIKNFGLGYSPKFGDSLYQHLINSGFKLENILETGLVKISEKGNKPYDAFWDRVMYPIFNVDGKVIGFGGRVLDDSKPKYLNSPETLIFDKGANLFGLNITKHYDNDFYICCEGYMDVIGMHSAGFHGAVASLGTALTPKQVDILKSLTDTVYLAYDSDGPGIKAGLRAIELFDNVDIQTKVINMSPYKDPDEFIKNLGKDEFINRINSAMPSKEFKVKGEYQLSILETNDEEKRKHLENCADNLLDIEL